ncbi:MAG: RNA polymerase sigma factor [Candidatus Altimarinota bacterium]
MSEQEIIRLCQKGKLEHFGELYEKYADPIYKFIYLKTYDKELSEDLTSQTFFKALDKIQSFKNDADSNFKAWIYRIAYNLVIDNYSGKKETVQMDELLEFGYDENFGQNLDNKEKLREIFAYFDTLKDKHKQILIMRLWDDLSYKEISELTGESLDNCKKVVSRTLSNIPTTYMSLLIILLLNI